MKKTLVINILSIQESAEGIKSNPNSSHLIFNLSMLNTASIFFLTCTKKLLVVYTLLGYNTYNWFINILLLFYIDNSGDKVSILQYLRFWINVVHYNFPYFSFLARLVIGFYISCCICSIMNTWNAIRNWCIQLWLQARFVAWLKNINLSTLYYHIWDSKV